MPLNEWELVPQMGLDNNIKLSELNMSGKHDYENSHTREKLNVPLYYHERII